MAFRSSPWRPQEGPQTEAIRRAWVTELLFGGSRGVGKSHWILGDFAQDVPRPGGESWHGILFRRTFPQLEDLIKKSKEIFPPWFGNDNIEWKSSENTWRWKNGASLKMRYADGPDDWMQYHGHEYGWIGFDELTTWESPELYMKLKATLRSANPLHKFKRIRATANPGGPGHNWVKSYFGIDRYPLGGVLLQDPASKMTRMYVRGLTTDNKILMAAQPEYLNILRATGSPEQVRQWLEGDWNAVPGAYFSMFSTEKHVITPFEVPPNWTRIRMMDWGGASPFAVLWAAISDGSPTWEGRVYPKGAMIIYREWYGAEANSEGRYVGIKMSNRDVAMGILERERTEYGYEQIDDSVIDPAAYAQAGGPSIAEQYARETDGRVMFRRGDNKRIPGWQQIRDRLHGGENGPMLYITTDCPHLIRTLPVLPHDQNKHEDIDTDAEDHEGDALRYGCMARPWAKDPPKPEVPQPTVLTLDQLWQERDSLRRIRIA